MNRGPVQPSRTRKDLREADAAAFAAMACRDLEAAVVMTVGWTRRRLIDVALTLAVKNAEQKPLTRDEAMSLPSLRTSLLPSLGGRRTALEIAWTDDNLRAAHDAYRTGHRSPWSVEGERIYQRLAVRRRRAS